MIVTAEKDAGNPDEKEIVTDPAKDPAKEETSGDILDNLLEDLKSSKEEAAKLDKT
jgi:hypothetical protein